MLAESKFKLLSICVCVIDEYRKQHNLSPVKEDTLEVARLVYIQIKLTISKKRMAK